MQIRAKVFDQPLNPLVAVLTLGIFGSTLLIDLGGLASGLHLFGVIAHADMTMGLLAGAVAVVAAFIDRLATPPGPARIVNARVAIALATMLGLFTLVWALRFGADRPNAGLVLLELLGFAAGTAGAWLSRTRPATGPMTVPFRFPSVTVPPATVPPATVPPATVPSATMPAAGRRPRSDFAARSIPALRQSTVPLSVLMR